MTLRLSPEDDAAVEQTAFREHISKQEVIVRAVRAYTSNRQQRLESSIARVVERDADALDRLGKA